MKNTQKNIISVAGAILLFLSFSVMHEYDWLIPPSPGAATATTTASVPMPDVIEEQGSEDEIEYDQAKFFNVIEIVQIKKPYMICGNLFVPRIDTPPPDVI